MEGVFFFSKLISWLSQKMKGATEDWCYHILHEIFISIERFKYESRV